MKTKPITILLLLSSLSGLAQTQFDNGPELAALSVADWAEENRIIGETLNRIINYGQCDVAASAL